MTVLGINHHQYTLSSRECQLHFVPDIEPIVSNSEKARDDAVELSIWYPSADAGNFRELTFYTAVAETQETRIKC
jgi:hypothetical protein